MKKNIYFKFTVIIAVFLLSPIFTFSEEQEKYKIPPAIRDFLSIPQEDEKTQFQREIKANINLKKLNLLGFQLGETLQEAEKKFKNAKIFEPEVMNSYGIFYRVYPFQLKKEVNTNTFKDILLCFSGKESEFSLCFVKISINEFHETELQRAVELISAKLKTKFQKVNDNAYIIDNGNCLLVVENVYEQIYIKLVDYEEIKKTKKNILERVKELTQNRYQEILN